MARQMNQQKADQTLPRGVSADESTQQGDPVLITLRVSHYCEKARWALDRVGYRYREESHVPVAHRLVTSRHRGSSVPLLLCADRRITESSDILRYINDQAGGAVFYPEEPLARTEVSELESQFDRVLGPHSRRWAYWHLLPDSGLMKALWAQGAPRREVLLLPLILPVARKLIRSAYKVTADGAQRSALRLQTVFDEVGERLSDGRPFLVGEQFTAADLTFASLSAPVILPPECQASLPALEQVPPAMRDQILRLRDTPAGQYGLQLYSNQREKVAKAFPDPA